MEKQRKKCDWCGEEIVLSEVRRDGLRFCSRSCADESDMEFEGMIVDMMRGDDPHGKNWELH